MKQSLSSDCEPYVEKKKYRQRSGAWTEGLLLAFRQAHKTLSSTIQQLGHVMVLHAHIGPFIGLYKLYTMHIINEVHHEWVTLHKLENNFIFR